MYVYICIDELKKENSMLILNVMNKRYPSYVKKKLVKYSKLYLTIFKSCHLASKSKTVRHFSYIKVEVYFKIFSLIIFKMF